MMMTSKRNIKSLRVSRSSFTFYFGTILIWIAMMHVMHVSGDGDWMKDCGVCHCKWSSSKKVADCKNSSLVSVPKEVTNELQVIELNNNNIPELRRNEFKEANLLNLHKIYMRNCTLQEIHRDAFRGLYLLIELDLTNNFLKTLEPGIFTDVMRLRVLMIVNNQIEQLEDHLFVNMTFLAKVDFTQNRLNYIAPQTFVNTPALKEIDLKENRLTVLQEDIFRNLDKLQGLTLYENPWNCSCELLQFQKYVRAKSLYTQPTSCYYPIQLRGKFWSDVPTESFACKPRIISPRDGATIDASDNVTITCQIRAAPKPEVKWAFNGETLGTTDRIHMRTLQEMNRESPVEIHISELTIMNVKESDRGTYTCIAENTGGIAKSNIQLTLVPFSEVMTGLGVIGSTAGIPTTDATNLLLIVCLIAIILLSMLILLVLFLCCYCRRVKKYSKNGSISENGLVSSKIDRSQDGSMLEGSVIMEMQKSLLTEVNPVEKPPRRNEIDGKCVNIDDGQELKKTLLDDQSYGNLEDETHSIALSDTTPRSRTTFVDDGYGTNLPPDLLSFPSRFTQSPSTQSSISNIPDGSLYLKSPLASPIYQHNMYGIPQAGYRTLQHPKNRNLAIINRNNSPFQPAPILYAPIVMKQGYVTIPRKPRTPSWAPSFASALVDFPPTSPTSTMSTELMSDPIYDNLGLRTSASGHSSLSVHKPPSASSIAAGNIVPNPYTMKDRPLPATPIIYEPIQEQQILTNANSRSNDETELLFNNTIDTNPIIVSANAINSNNGHINSNKSNIDQQTMKKVPPRPPPKPKKKIMPTISAITENPEQHLVENGANEYDDDDDDCDKGKRNDGGNPCDDDGTEV